MSRKKLAKFAELSNFPHVFEKPDQMPTWPTPLIVELGCGYGEYTLALAQRYPVNHYVGMDIQGERLWRGATASETLHLNNVWWLRGFVDHLPQYFAPQTITEIWLTFPDPHPKKGGTRKRLTNPRFLEFYKQLLVPGGRCHLKTDSDQLFNYSQDSIVASGGVIDGYTGPDLDIITRYEKKHRALGAAIHYVTWHWPEYTSPTPRLAGVAGPILGGSKK
ncbi:MAG: tRNA (guanosine(46)-N7)-methyltransferase TrmB [Patescibacteria group bacterium]|jgi:tRNA (guanine-N7-)-methyltransferase